MDPLPLMDAVRMRVQTADKNIHTTIIFGQTIPLTTIGHHSLELYGEEDHVHSVKILFSRGENQKGVSDIFGEMAIYIYIYIIKALSTGKLLLGSPVKLVKCHLRPSGSHPSLCFKLQNEINE